MVYKPMIRLRHYNWLRYNRVLINSKAANKGYSFLYIKKLLKRNNNVLFLNAFALISYKNLNIRSTLPNLHMATKQCIFGGKSKGVRWSLHRMKLLNISFKGMSGSLMSSRW